MRGDGKPKTRHDVFIEDEQWAQLQVIAEHNPDGCLAIAAVIRKALQEFIDDRFARNPKLLLKYSETRLERGNVVPFSGSRRLRDEKGGR